MPTTVTSGIEWDEHFEGWQEHWTYDEVSVQRVGDVAWDDADTFLADMLGSHSLVQGQIQRVLPEFHPDFPWLHVTECNLIATLGQVGFDPANADAITYERYRYQIKYAALPYEVLTDPTAYADPRGELSRYVERLQTYAAENVNLGGNAFTWLNDDVPAGNLKPIPETGTKTFFTKELTYIWNLVPGTPDANIQGCIGCVNNDTFDNFYAPGTLLFLSPDIKRLPSTPQGDVLYRISYKFLWRASGWNALFNRDDPYNQNNPPIPGFYPVSSSGRSSGKPIYPLADFSKLYSFSTD